MSYKRKAYLDRLVSLVGVPLIKTIVGMRRVGKSTLLQQFMQEVGHKKCLYINFEQLEFAYLLDYKKLHDYITENITNKDIVIIDEIQMVENWSLCINSLFSQWQTSKDFYITGSNSELLSSEISTHLRGRTYDLIVYPLSYSEFCEYHQVESGSNSWNDYVNKGGLLGSYQLPSQQITYEYIKGIINTIFIKDIVARYNIKEVFLLEELLLFVITNIGNKTNISNIINYMNNKGYKTNYITIGNYMSYLISAQIIYEASSWDIKGKKIFDRERKYYICDHLFWYVYLGTLDQGYGKLYENIVYVSGLRHGYQVFVGKQIDSEIDFVLQKNDQKLYIQVAYLLANEDVIQREYHPLLITQDSRPKYVLTEDSQLLKKIDGVTHDHIWNIDTILK